eukprot:3963612-Pyramimonas_sp.AAC.1
MASPRHTCSKRRIMRQNTDGATCSDHVAAFLCGWTWLGAQQAAQRRLELRASPATWRPIPAGGAPTDSPRT